MIVDYANSDLSKDFVQMRINKIVDPLYTNQDTKEFAIFNGKASGTIEEGTTDDLKAFTSNDFSAGFYVNAEQRIKDARGAAKYIGVI